MAMNERLVDYFIVVGCGETLKPLKNQDLSINGSYSFYQASVTDRYPAADFPGMEYLLNN